MFFGFRFFGPRCKKGKIWKATQKRKNWLITEKLFFGIFAVFCLASFFLFFCFFCFCVFFGGFKGQVRWPEGPPHLTLNPPYYFFFCFFFFVLFFCWFFFEGLRVSPPHLLGPKPSLFVFVFWGFLIFWFFFYTKQKPCFPPRKGHFWFIFSVSLSFSLSLFWPPSSVSLSLSLSFLLFFIPSCLCFFLSFGSLFGSLSLFFFPFWGFFHERNNIKIFNCKFFFINILSFLVSCLFLFQVLFSYLCSFLTLSYVFCSTSRFLISKQTTYKKSHFLVKRGVATKRFFYQPVFWKMSKVIVFLPFFLAIFGWCSKNTIK